jgi:beta-lactamase class A
MSGLSRRQLLVSAAAMMVAPARSIAQTADAATVEALAALERRAGGRLGVCCLDTASGRLAGQRLDERFAMCSTFKLPLAEVVLREADQGRLRLDERLAYGEKDLVANAPVTRAHVAAGAMTIEALAEAAQTTSDNTAANLLLRKLGGPAGFTALLRASGDTVTRLDRLEPELNLVLAGEVHDTTTPRAMAKTAARFLTGGLLAAESRDRLVSWMVATTTGMKRIRAGLPVGWKAGDKTGTALADVMTDKYNDVAVAWPPGRAPMIVAAYFDSARKSSGMRDEDQMVLAEVGRIAAAWIAG